MNLAATQIYALTKANGEAIAGLRVDMASMQTGVHADMFALKAALDLQGDSLRNEIGVTAASLRADMTAFRDAVSQRFERADTQLSTFRREMDERFTAADGKFAGAGQRFNAVDQRFNTVDAKLDTLIAEIRGGRD